jgi:hypothetical protein
LVEISVDDLNGGDKQELLDQFIVINLDIERRSLKKKSFNLKVWEEIISLQMKKYP